MKIHKECQIEKCASKEKNRVSLQHAYLKGSQLIATNGKAMVQLPVELQEHDVDGYVSTEALKAARKAAGRLDQASLQANGALTLPSGQSFPRPTEASVGYPYPNCDPVWNPVWGRDYKWRVALDAGMLLEIAQAMGTEGVILEITGENEPIRVRPTSTRTCSVAEPKAKGILMPIKIA